MSWLVIAGIALAAEPASAATQAPPAPPSPSSVAMQSLESKGVRITLPASIIDGRLVPIELTLPSGRSCNEPKVYWQSGVYTPYPVGDRWHVLVPTKLELKPGKKTLQVKCGKQLASFTLDVARGEYPESKLSVDPKFSAPAPPQVATENATIDEAYKKGGPTRRWSEAFVRPTDGIDTSPFGVRRTFNGATKSRHRGLDMDGKVGDPVRAANTGVVVLAAADYYYTGNAVFIDHGDRLFSVYFHLSRMDVKTGDVVERGQVIGALGSTGRVTAPHLHFGVKLAGQLVDPRDLLAYVPAPTGR